MLKSEWIFSKSIYDIFFLFLVGPIAALVYTLLPTQQFQYFAILVLILLDSGHVYTTLWRTLFHGKNDKKIYYWAISVIVIFFFILSLIEFKYFWSLVLYATLFHYVKQCIGFYHRYRCKIAANSYDLILTYALFLTPFILYHFNPTHTNIDFYAPHDYIPLPHEGLHRLQFPLLIMVWLIYLIRTIYRLIHKNISLAEMSYVISTSLFFAFLFLGNSFQSNELIIPLVVGHALPYIVLMGKSLQKTKPLEIFQSKAMVTIILLATISIFGLFEHFAENEIINFDIGDNQNAGIDGLIRALYLTPLFLHFFADSQIWKRRHPDFPHF